MAWKRLTSPLHPRTLASGIKAISAALNPTKVSQVSKADQALDEWEDKLAKLDAEYNQELTHKMKVAVMFSMVPKELQEKVLDACAVAWDGTSEAQCKDLYTKVKLQLKNIAKGSSRIHGAEANGGRPRLRPVGGLVRE